MEFSHIQFPISIIIDGVIDTQYEIYILRISSVGLCVKYTYKQTTLSDYSLSFWDLLARLSPHRAQNGTVQAQDWTVQAQDGTFQAETVGMHLHRE